MTEHEDFGVHSFRGIMHFLDALSCLLEGERRVITAMFADVKGSTALAERIDVETWVEIMNHVFQILGAAIYRYGGVIDRVLCTFPFASDVERKAYLEELRSA